MMKSTILNTLFPFALVLFCFIGTSDGLNAQKMIIPEDAPRKAVKAFERGREAQKAGALDDALERYQKALDAYPDFQSARILVASIHYERKDFNKAEASFKKVLERDAPYPHKVHLTLGIIQYKLDKFEDSYQNLSRFLEEEEDNEDLIKKAQRFLSYANFAKEAVKHPLDFNPVSIGDKINTGYNEYMPSITADGIRLVFSRREAGFEYLYESIKKDGVWQSPRPMDEINSIMEGGAHTISADGRWIVFTNCERRLGFGSCDLFYTRLKRGQWTKPRNMGRPVNSSAWDSQPSLADNGKTLYFSSNRQGTLGGKDIWVTRRTEAGGWGKPENLGPTINSPKDEKTPFVHFDARTMYFMSNGYPGMGDFDLYISKLQEDGTWTTPKNLGYPINTKFQEGTLVVDLAGKKGYITSDRHHAQALNKGVGHTETDIYEFDLPGSIAPMPSTFVEINVIDKETRIPLDAEIKIVIPQPRKLVHSGTVQKDGYELVCLPLGKTYSVRVSHPEYTFFSERITLDEIYTLDEPFVYLIELEKPEDIKEDIPIVLKNVLFETGKALLQSEADEEIGFLSAWLKEHEGVNVEIRGHTDNVGNAEDNLELSKARALAVVDALIKDGVPQSRITWNGFGETQPLVENDTPEGRAVNRRTEFVLKKK